MNCFENEHIKLDVERQPGCKVSFKITTLPLATKAAEVAAVKAISKEVNIPGFRKGRAPDSLVKTQFQNQIKKEFISILTNNSFAEASKLSKIFPLNQETQVKLLQCEPINETSYEIAIEFESYPDIPKIERSDLTLENREAAPVTEEQIDRRMQDFRLHYATREEVIDRPAQEGDFVTLSIELVEPHTVLHENTQFHLRKDILPEWLIHLVIGLSTGENKIGSDENGHSYRVELKKIEQALLPPLDDELAKKGGVETVEALKAAITRSLEKESSQKARQELRIAAKKLLLSTYPFELPQGALKRLLQECKDLLVNEDSLPQEEKEQETHQLFSRKKDDLSFSYLIHKLYQDDNLQLPTSEEVQKRATEEMLMLYMRGEKNISENDLAHFSHQASLELMAEKALDFVLDGCKRV